MSGSTVAPPETSTASIGYATPAAAPEESNLATLIEQFGADNRAVRSFYDVQWSEERFDRIGQMLDSWSALLADMDFHKLSRDSQVDYLLLSNHIQAEKDDLALQQTRLAEMEPLMPFRKAIQDLDEAREKMQPADPRAAAQVLATIPDQIKAVRAEVEKGRDANNKDADAIRVSKVLAQRTAGAVNSIVSALDGWNGYYSDFVPGFDWWVRQPRDKARSALTDYARFLREDIAGIHGNDDDPLLGDPIGRAALMNDIRREMIAYTPEEMIDIAQREYDWCEGEMKKASNEMGSGDDWKAALAKVKADHVDPGQQDDFIRAQAEAAIVFVTDHHLVTVPPLCRELWRTEMMSAQTQKYLPFAAYSGQSMLVAYPTNDMSEEDKLMSMRGNNKSFTHIVTAHELIPGHHLQGFMADRVRTDRSMFNTPFYVEGWALYWEMTLWNEGYGSTPEQRIGMLFWRMHRCARIIVSLKFHLGEMTPEQMIDFLVDKVGHERFGATSEVRRYIGGSYSPLYQCGYMIGGLQLMALRHELVDSGSMTEQQYNDAVLKQNTIPVAMVRAALNTSVTLTRDWTPTWRFADELGLGADPSPH